MQSLTNQSARISLINHSSEQPHKKIILIGPKINIYENLEVTKGNTLKGAQGVTVLINSISRHQ